MDFFVSPTWTNRTNLFAREDGTTVFEHMFFPSDKDMKRIVNGLLTVHPSLGIFTLRICGSTQGLELEPTAKLWDVTENLLMKYYFEEEPGSFPTDHFPAALDRLHEALIKAWEDDAVGFPNVMGESDKEQEPAEGDGDTSGADESGEEEGSEESSQLSEQE